MGRTSPGTRPFGPDDGSRLFGRAAAVSAVAELWMHHRMTFLSGPAGIGKTSLLSAGVLPKVESSNVSLLPLGHLSGGSTYPLGALRRYNPYTLALLRSWSAQSVARLADFTVDEFVGQQAQSRDETVVILAAIDQADDLLTGPDARQPDRRRFLRELADALHEYPTLHLLISIRPHSLPPFRDVLGDVVEHQRYDLLPLDPGETRQAIEEAGFFGPEMAGELVEFIQTSRVAAANGQERRILADKVEPALLDAVYSYLRESLKEPRRGLSGLIARRERLRYGHVDAALAGYCGTAIAAVAQMHGIPAACLRRWLIHTFISDAEPPNAVAGAPGAGCDVPDAAVDALEDRHVLRGYAGRSGGQPHTGAGTAGPRRYALLSERLAEPLRQTREETSAPADPAEHLRAAERALTTGDLQLAETLADTAESLALDTDLRVHAEASSLRGKLAYEHGALDQAEAHYRRAAQLFEAIEDTGAVACLLGAVGLTLALRNELGEALKQLTAALNRAPDDPVIQAELNWTVQELARHTTDIPPFRLSAF